MRISGFNSRFPLAAGVLWIATFVASAAADAQEVSALRESAIIESDDRFERKLSVVRDFVGSAQWPEAIQLIQEIADEHGKNLFAISPGRYVNIGTYTGALLASLPAEARDVYRRRVDASVHAKFLSASERRDEAALRGIVRDSFNASDTDNALLLLGDWAWERGDFATARNDWQRILPVPEVAGETEPTATLGYPDTEFDAESILARLVLCSIAEGNRARAAGELAAFRKRYPDALGRLAGRDGKLAEILEELLAASRSWEKIPESTDDATFAGTPARTGDRCDPVEIGPPRWSAPLPPTGLATEGSRLALPDAGPLSEFPLSYGRMLLLCGAGEIEARDVATGEPVWGKAGSASATVYPPLFDARVPTPGLPVLGLPSFTMTLVDGRLYARMGVPIVERARRELGEFESDIVCLDLDGGEGKLVWIKSAGELSGGGDAFWSFEGSPVVVDGRAYAAYRYSSAQATSGVACLDADNGRILWKRDVCTSAVEVPENENRVSHQLLAVAEGRIYYATGFGAVAALSTGDGLIEWAVTYPVGAPEPGRAKAPARWQLTPCVVHQGTVFVATDDGARLMALDGPTGLVRWVRQIPGGLEHILGVGAHGLIASGRDLWSIEPLTGRVQWHLGYRDPAGWGYGRGLLAGDVVYWPKRDEIQIVDQFTGEIRREVPLRALYGETGGNLVIAGDRLVVVQADRVVAFGKLSEKSPERTRDLSWSDWNRVLGLDRR